MKRTNILAALALTAALLLSACGPSATPEPTPTPVDIPAIQTRAVGQFILGLTETAIANPSPTPTGTPSPTATNTPASTGAASIPTLSGGGTVQPTQSCYSMAFVADITIPDNTNIAPGQTFTKTWKVVNNGTCAWEVGFMFAFVGGDQMNGATVTLTEAVAVNEQVEFSVDFTAPTNKTGKVQSNWRMSTASGTFFGDEVYVIIEVGGSTLTPTATDDAAPSETPTPSETPSPTPTS
ncbi:MAG: NBR1-Ig-like domain-containing protein [Chloroflexota bacterium]